MHWLKYKRIAKGMTQEDVAKLASISRSTYGHIETGKRGITVKNAKKIAEILDIDWTIFFEH